jgi:Leucine Rich repeat
MPDANPQLSPASSHSQDSRPEFLHTLGLIPPCTVEDVHQAYLSKVKTAHPDVGGDPAEFRKLQEAYERATEWAKFRASRIKWLSTWVEKYVEQDALVADIQQRGGKVHTEGVDWLRRSFGDDFSVVADKVTGIDLTGPKVDDNTISWLASHRAALTSLKSLNLSGSAITDSGLQHAAAFPNLHKLDLSDTAITGAGLYVLQRLAMLNWLGLHNTRVGWFARTKLKWKYPKLEVAI